jgi:hypothetical protein
MTDSNIMFDCLAVRRHLPLPAYHALLFAISVGYGWGPDDLEPVCNSQ